MAKLKYVVNVSVGERTIEIKEDVETNYKMGEARQLANTFFRAMLAFGYDPVVVADAFSRVSLNAEINPMPSRGLFGSEAELGG